MQYWRIEIAMIKCHRSVMAMLIMLLLIIGLVILFHDQLPSLVGCRLVLDFRQHHPDVRATARYKLCLPVTITTATISPVASQRININFVGGGAHRSLLPLVTQYTGKHFITSGDIIDLFTCCDSVSRPVDSQKASVATCKYMQNTNFTHLLHF